MNLNNLDFAAAILNVSLLWILTVPHEFAHAWVATLLGDDTPRRCWRPVWSRRFPIMRRAACA